MHNLLPNGFAWKGKEIGGELYKLLKSLNLTFDNEIDKIENIRNENHPALKTAAEKWGQLVGISDRSDLEKLKLKIKNKLIKKSPMILENFNNALKLAGFDLIVRPTSATDDLTKLIISEGVSVVFNANNIQFGGVNIQFGVNTGAYYDILASTISRIANKIYTKLFGGVDVSFNTASFGEYRGVELSESTEVILPNNRLYDTMILILEGENNSVGTVPSVDEEDLKKLIYSLKPTFMWVLMRVVYV